MLVATRNVERKGQENMGAVYPVRCYAHSWEKIHEKGPVRSTEPCQEVIFYRGTDVEQGLRWVWYGNDNEYEVQEQLNAGPYVHDCQVECRLEKNNWFAYRPYARAVEPIVVRASDLQDNWSTLNIAFGPCYAFACFKTRERATEWANLDRKL